MHPEEEQKQEIRASGLSALEYDGLKSSLNLSDTMKSLIWFSSVQFSFGWV